MDGAPLPSSREDLQYQVSQLQHVYLERWHTDPEFHARGKTIGQFLEQLDSIHEGGDNERVGFLVAALMEEYAGQRMLLSHAWERGMADAKLQALGIKPHVRNPYLKEGE